jgi:hypothetical protein
MKMAKVKSNCKGNKQDEVNGSVAVCTKTQATISKCNRKETKITGTPSRHGQKKIREKTKSQLLSHGGDKYGFLGLQESCSMGVEWKEEC